MKKKKKCTVDKKKILFHSRHTRAISKQWKQSFPFLRVLSKHGVYFYKLFSSNQRLRLFLFDRTKLVSISVQFSCSAVFNSLWPHGLYYTRIPCPPPTPGTCSNSCPSSWWCHPTISFSVIPFSSCFQSFPTSGSFQMSQFFASGGQGVGVSVQHQSF